LIGRSEFQKTHFQRKSRKKRPDGEPKNGAKVEKRDFKKKPADAKTQAKSMFSSGGRNFRKLTFNENPGKNGPTASPKMEPKVENCDLKKIRPTPKHRQNQAFIQDSRHFEKHALDENPTKRPDGERRNGVKVENRDLKKSGETPEHMQKQDIFGKADFAKTRMSTVIPESTAKTWNPKPA